MSMSSSLFRHKDNDYSSDITDLRQQNRVLYQENTTLKKSLQELIAINTQLTESIEEFNGSHMDNFPHINQQEIEQLAHQVIELQQELEKEKQEKAQANQQSGSVEETLKVIEELVGSFQSMQDEYQQELERIEQELTGQREQWTRVTEAVEQKLSTFEGEYQQLLQDLRRSEGTIRRMEEQMQGRGLTKKQLKISTTIEDLRMTLERQIQQKQRVIRYYENLIEEVQGRLGQKAPY